MDPTLSSSETGTAKPELPPISRRRQKRIREIQDLRDSGWKEAEIAEKYGISIRMVERDVQLGKMLDRMLVQDINQADIIGKVTRGYEREMRQELRAAQLATNPFVRVAHKRNYITLIEKYVKFLQGIGIVTEMPKQIDLFSGISFKNKEVRMRFLDFLQFAKEMGEKIFEP
jgi:hypothetical protein